MASPHRKVIFQLFAVFLVAFILRVDRLDYPLSHVFAWGDGARDYLVANHIAKYGEIPLNGPYNLLAESGIYNSPIYFYVLALPLLFFNHPLTLGVFNIFLQILTLVLIFLIAKAAFNEKVAVMALVLFAFNPEIIRQSDYIWQPHLMMPLAYLALYLIILSYQKTSYKLLLVALFTISFAFVNHNSAFSYLVVFLTLTFFILRKEKRTFKYYLGAVLVVVSTLITFYLPVIIFSPSLPTLSFQNINVYLQNFVDNLDEFSNTFYVNKTFLALVLILASLLYKRGRYVILISLLFLLPIAFAAFPQKIRFHYLALSSGMFAIVLAYLLEILKPKVFKLLILGMFVYIFSGNFYFIKDFKRPFENLKFLDEITKSVILELDLVKKNEGFKNYDFFQVKSYALDKYAFEYPVLDTILLNPLEIKLNQKLAKISDESPYNHIQINKKSYLVLVCYKFQSYQTSNCQIDFLKNSQDYNVIKTLYLSEYISLYFVKEKTVANLKAN